MWHAVPETPDIALISSLPYHVFFDRVLRANRSGALEVRTG